MLYLLLLIAVAMSSYTAFQVFAIRESIDELHDRIESALTPQVAYKHPPPMGLEGRPNFDGAERAKPEDLRLRGL